MTKKSRILLISELDGTHPVNRVFGRINLSYSSILWMWWALRTSAIPASILIFGRWSGGTADVCPCRTDRVRGSGILHLSQRRFYVFQPFLESF